MYFVALWWSTVGFALIFDSLLIFFWYGGLCFVKDESRVLSFSVTWLFYEVPSLDLAYFALCNSVLLISCAYMYLRVFLLLHWFLCDEYCACPSAWVSKDLALQPLWALSCDPLFLLSLLRTAVTVVHSYNPLLPFWYLVQNFHILYI